LDRRGADSVHLGSTNFYGVEEGQLAAGLVERGGDGRLAWGVSVGEKGDLRWGQGGPVSKVEGGPTGEGDEISREQFRGF